MSEPGIGLLSSFAENCKPLRVAEICRYRAERVKPAGIVSREVQNGPIAPPQAPRRAKNVEDMLDVRLEVFCGLIGPGFCEQAGNLAEGVRHFAEKDTIQYLTRKNISTHVGYSLNTSMNHCFFLRGSSPMFLAMLSELYQGDL